jgi:hypothetical protein
MEGQGTTHRVKESYKQYGIEVVAIAVRTGGFTPHLTIRKDARSYVDETPIHTGKVFPTENEALQSGLSIGKRMIDTGFQPKWVVTNQ